MRRITLLVALAGLAAATALVAREGAGAVRAAFSAAGWGVVWASLFHFVSIALNALAWQALLGRGRGRSLPFLGFLIWVREAVNGLLPVARVGGEVANARLMMRGGVGAAPAVASLVVSMTVTLVTQLVFALLGVALLLERGGSGGALVRAIGISICVAVPIVFALALIQRAGLFQHLSRVIGLVGGGRFAGLISSAERLDRAVRVLWARRGRIAACAGWQLAGWIAGAGEIWIFVHSAGTRMSWADAIRMESLVQALTSAAFLVPAALGVQEGAFVALGTMVGLPPATALAAALARRARDVIVLVPALIVWQALEGRSLFRPRRGRGEPAA